jgi:type II secretion system protein G
VLERYRKIQMRRVDGESREAGFTLIELLIVIVVLGILAAIVVFSLSGVTGQSKSASCNADAKTVEIAVDAYNAEAGAFPTNSAALLGTAQTGGPFLHQWPSTNNGYTITIDTQGGVFVNGGTYDSSGGGTNPCAAVS